MADQEILGEAMQREINTMEIFLVGKVNRTTVTLEEFIEGMQSQGASNETIRELLETDLNEGGRIFGEFKRGIKSTASGSVQRFSDVGKQAEIGVEGQFRWIAVLRKTCPDCIDRHGVVKSFEEWEADGLPRSGQTVCREFCECELVPAETSEVEPIRMS